jgi:kynurenine formamidase
MALLNDFLLALRAGSIDIVDLTAPLSSGTPILSLPEQFGQTLPFRLDQISRYDDLGPGWYWNNISTGEHTGTHFDAPIHWVTGRDKADVAQVPAAHLVAAAAVIDVAAQAKADPDFLLGTEHIEAWEREHGALPTTPNT